MPAWPGEGALSGEGWAFSFPVQHSTWHVVFDTRGVCYTGCWHSACATDHTTDTTEENTGKQQ